MEKKYFLIIKIANYVEKLKHKYRDVSMLESVIGGDNKGRFTIIFFNSKEEIKIFDLRINK